MMRDLGDGHLFADGVNTNGSAGVDHERASVNGQAPSEDLDVAIIGAGFAGCYLLYQLRKQGFTTKVIEAGSGLGGIWHWNTYPGARVDSPYPVYGYSLPEVYEDWDWTEQYPGHVEMRAYFDHVDKKLDIRTDTLFNTKVVAATFDTASATWTIVCNTGKTIRARQFIACQGFAAKRYFPDWEGLDSYEGIIHHSSFWPKEGIDVKGMKCGVVGTGATGIQITQEWARDIDDAGSVKMFQRTANMACAMNQKIVPKDVQLEDKKNFTAIYKERYNNFNGFLYQTRPDMMFDHTEEERLALFEELWAMVSCVH